MKLAEEYLLKQETSKWLHTNNNDYDNLKNINSNSVFNSEYRNDHR